VASLEPGKEIKPEKNLRKACANIAEIGKDKMKIAVKYFASMRETMGKADEQTNLDEGATVNDLWASVATIPMAENTLIAVNMEYTNADHVLVEGDEVAFFPPVTGG